MSKITGLILHNMTPIEKIRIAIEGEVFDYTQLMDALKEYKKPRDVVSTLLKKAYLIRLRKGLYTFGKLWQRKGISNEVLANLMYGPSVISLDFALSLYGLIPEHTFTVTCVSIGRSRVFNTPVGRFSYTQQKVNRFSFGYSLQHNNSGNFLIAEPLKALADKVWYDKRFNPTSPVSYYEYLFEDLCIDKDILFQHININYLKVLNDTFSSRKISWLTKFLIDYKSE